MKNFTVAKDEPVTSARSVDDEYNESYKFVYVQLMNSLAYAYEGRMIFMCILMRRRVVLTLHCKHI